MKTIALSTLGALTVALTSCGSLQNIKNLKQPLSGNTNFDPLRSPGSTLKSYSSSSSSSTARKSVMVAPTSPSYKAGQWVETSMPNATFFRKIPKGNARADKVLKVATPLKVISSKSTYIKVELDSGDVGYVPEIMLVERPSSPVKPSSSPIAPVPEFGSVPPPVEPGNVAPAPAPKIPSVAPPVPTVPTVPTLPPVPVAPTLPDAPPVPNVSTPPVPESGPTVPDVAPPPEIPGITAPVDY